MEFDFEAAEPRNFGVIFVLRSLSQNRIVAAAIEGHNQSAIGANFGAVTVVLGAALQQSFDKTHLPIFGGNPKPSLTERSSLT